MSNPETYGLDLNTFYFRTGIFYLAGDCTFLHDDLLQQAHCRLLNCLFVAGDMDDSWSIRYFIAFSFCFSYTFFISSYFLILLASQCEPFSMPLLMNDGLLWILGRPTCEGDRSLMRKSLSFGMGYFFNLKLAVVFFDRSWKLLIDG